MSADEKFSSIVGNISSKKNIVVLAGAGISVSCGIPDFRSHGTGLYHTLNYRDLGLANPEDLFDIETFRDNPRPFFRFARNLYPGKIEPSPSHKFLAWLDKKNILLRVYTQNVDGLEELAGVNKRKVVYAHGSLLKATCMKCGAKYTAQDIAIDVKEGRVPLCQRSKERKTQVATKKNAETKLLDKPVCTRTLRKRSFQHYSGIDGITPNANSALCGGVVKPNITFFGEKLASDVGLCLQRDYARADAFIVMGTSLSVAPMSKVVEFLPPNLFRVLINRNLIQPSTSSKADNFSFDACLLGNCDEIVEAIKRQMTRSFDSDSAIDAPKNVVTCNDTSWLKNQPLDSVLLFNGAITNTITDTSTFHKLVVYCDGCKCEIKGTIHCCTTCFDFDLCGECFPSLSLTHADGSHEFTVEKDDKSA